MAAATASRSPADASGSAAGGRSRSRCSRPPWPGWATQAAQEARVAADTGGVDTLLRRPLLALLAGALPALLLVALTAGALPAAAGAGEYGANAPIPFLLLPPDNPWNARVDGLPLDPNSDGYIAHMAPGAGLHPDFGTVWEGAPIGIPYVVVPGDQPKVTIDFYYPDESDPGPYPIPPDAPVEGAGGPFDDGDRHVLVLDADNQLLYEVYDAHRDGDHWHAGSGAVFDLTSNALRPDGWTSADAAGLPILPGLVRYDEAVEEGVIDHALRFTVETTQRAYVYPATHFASEETDPDLPPMGLRLRLKASFDIGGFPAELRVVLQALKTYGMMVADNGADWFVGGAPDPRWDDEALSAIRAVKGSDFEVVDSRYLVAKVFTVSLPATAMALEGDAWTAAGSFVDESGSAWSATVDYGVGPEPLKLDQDKSFELAHTWLDDGTCRVPVTVTSDLACTSGASVAVDVINVAPRVRAGGAANVAGGALLTRLGAFADPGADTWTGAVDWGDGSARTALALRADKTFTLAHRFPRGRGRGYTVVVTVRDDDGGSGSASFRVTVR